MNQKIEFNYQGKDYTLEYDRNSVRVMEANGLRIGEIEDQPYSMITILWQGAFLKNHKKEKAELIQEIYDQMPNRAKLNAALIAMFNETYASLIGDVEEDETSKNLEWKMA